jgi:hypothetical protein
MNVLKHAREILFACVKIGVIFFLRIGRFEILISLKKTFIVSVIDSLEYRCFDIKNVYQLGNNILVTKRRSNSKDGKSYTCWNILCHAGYYVF